MRYILEIENPENIRVLVMQDLKELGIKVPKIKKNKAKEDSINVSNHAVFGNFLNLVPCLMIEECGPVPKFLVQATHILDKHIDIEGLFRKSGSVARIKELKIKIEAGEDILEANPLDVAGLIKQFFRELPDPLFTSRLHDTFVRCHSIDSEDARVTAILLLCHQLPWHHLSTLRYVMLFLQKVAHNCDLNKMDIANLAVCLTPNLMHHNLSLPGKSDKMNTEGQILQIQTNIVQILILWAGDIGMVPDSLYDRALLMSACFPTDDELEKSEANGCAAAETDGTKSTKGKKKRRSGSLQGLVSNLSNSFSKWRKDSKAHNASSLSDRSTMSYMSFEKSSMMASMDQTDLSRMTMAGHNGGVASGTAEEYLDPAFLEATPKVIRKRKAEDEAVPFSASKKKAILQNMPQMSALGNTPFTPAARKGRYPGEFQETPNIKFVDAENMIFSANATPCMQTPKRKMDKLFSPYSTTKVKRQSSGKSSCFSPKAPKSNVRKSVRGFFRRLSGGKDPQASPGGASYSEAGHKLTGVPDSLLIMDPAAGHKKKSFFRRHKKTPSSPARLVTHLTAELQREKAAMASSRGSSVSSVCQRESDMDASLNKSEMVSRLGSDLNLHSPHLDGDRTACSKTRGDLSLDTTNASLRRGKPNTVKTGLHEYIKRRSLDVQGPNDEAEEGHKLRDAVIETVPNTIDTSPILKDNGPLLGGCSPSEEIDVDSCATPKAHVTCMSRTNSQISLLSHHSSKTSLLSLANPAESGLDQAFINESAMLADTTSTLDTANETGVLGKTLEDTGKCGGDEVFDHPQDKQYSVTYKCVGMSMEKCVDSGSHSASDKNTRTDLCHQHSIDSIDSAIDTDCVREEMRRSSASLHSIQSCDSGLDVNNTDRNNKISVKSDSSLVARTESQRARRRSAEPNLKISAETHHMLTKAGKLDSCSMDVSQCSMDTSDSNAALQTSAALRESVLELHQAGKVSAAKQQLEEVAELEKRKESPLRFANSMMRKNPNASPVRIPTIFAKSEKEASHFRELAKAALTSNSKTASIRTPNLPITSNLVRGNVSLNNNLMAARIKSQTAGENAHNPETLDPGYDGSAGHTPARSLQSGMRVINFNESLKSDNKEQMPIIPAKIKPTLLAASDSMNYKVVNKVLTGSAACVVDMSKNKYRSPMKPIKRLQSSPISPHNRRNSRSPRRLSISPHKTSAASSSSGKPHGLSPMPSQGKDWNI